MKLALAVAVGILGGLVVGAGGLALSFWLCHFKPIGRASDRWFALLLRFGGQEDFLTKSDNTD